MLLTTMNNMVQYQYEGNVHLIYAILRRKEIFYKLARLTLPRAIRDIKQLQKQDYYKSFGGNGKSMASGLTSIGSGSSIGSSASSRRPDNVDAEIFNKMALTTTPTDLISTTLEERDIRGNVRNGKSTQPNSTGTADDIIDVNLVRMSSSFSVLDRTGSFTGEFPSSQKQLSPGEGFVRDGEKIEQFQDAGMDSSYGHENRAPDASESDSDGDFSTLEVMTLKQRSEDLNDDGEIGDDGSAAEPEGRSIQTSLSNSAKGSKSILQDERKAEYLSKRMKSSLSDIGRKDRFVPDKVMLQVCDDDVDECKVFLFFL